MSTSSHPPAGEKIDEKVTILFEGSKSFWRTQHAIDCSIFEHRTSSSSRSNDNTIIQLVVFDPDNGREQNVYLSGSLLFNKISNSFIPHGKGLRVQPFTSYANSLISKYIYARIELSTTLNTDENVNVDDATLTTHNIITLIPMYGDVLNEHGRLDVEIEKPISGLGILPPMIRHRRFKAEEWDATVQKFRQENAEINYAIDKLQNFSDVADDISEALSEKTLTIEDAIQKFQAGFLDLLEQQKESNDDEEEEELLKQQIKFLEEAAAAIDNVDDVSEQQQPTQSIIHPTPPSKPSLQPPRRSPARSFVASNSPEAIAMSTTARTAPNSRKSSIVHADQSPIPNSISLAVAAAAAAVILLPSNKETTNRRTSASASLSPREQRKQSVAASTTVTDAAVTVSTPKERHQNTTSHVGIQSRSSSPKAITNSSVRALSTAITPGIPISTTGGTSSTAVNHNATKTTRSMAAKSFIEPSTASGVMKAAAATAIASFHNKSHARTNGKKNTKRKKKSKQINADESSSAGTGTLSPRTVKQGRKRMKKKNSKNANALARSSPTTKKGKKSDVASLSEEEDDDDSDSDDDNSEDDDDDDNDDEEESDEDDSDENSSEEEEEEEGEESSSEEDEDDSQQDSSMIKTTKRATKRNGIKSPLQSLSTRHGRGMPPITLESRSFGDIEEIEGKIRRGKQLESEPKTDDRDVVEESTTVPMLPSVVEESINGVETRRTHLNGQDHEQGQEVDDGKKKRSHHRVLHVADSTSSSSSSSSNNCSPAIPSSSRKSRQPSFNAGGTLTSYDAAINTDWTNVNALLRKQGVPNVEAQRKSLSPSKIHTTVDATLAAAIAMNNQISYPHPHPTTSNILNPSSTTNPSAK